MTTGSSTPPPASVLARILSACDELAEAATEEELARRIEHLAAVVTGGTARVVPAPTTTEGAHVFAAPLRRAWLEVRTATPLDAETRLLLARVATMAVEASDRRDERVRREAECRHLAHTAAELRDTEERLDRTIDDAPIGMTLVGVDGTFQRVNKALCDLVGYAPEELIHLRFQDVTHPDDLASDLRLLEELIRNERARYDLEKRYVRRDGTIVHVHLYVSALRAADGRILQFISQILDVTDRVRAARELERLEQLRVEWTSLVAHELRQPLTVVRTSATVLARREEADVRRSAEHILTSSARLNRMISDLQDLSRIEARRLTVALQRVETRPVLAGLVERLATSTKGPAIELRAADVLPDVRADPERLEQVLSNLVGNAVKYGDGVTPIVVGAEPAAQDVAFSVSNRGRGITPEEQGRLFDRFRRGAAGVDAPGLGLGLYIARGLVEAMGGRIGVESTPGEWTTFRFTVPRAPA